VNGDDLEQELSEAEIEESVEETLSFGEPAAAAPSEEIVLSLVDVAKSYYKGDQEVRVLDGLDLEVPSGGFEALMGPSGSGKSTLLNLIAGLDRPTAGSIRVAGADLGSMSERQMSRWRAYTIGFIFQQYNLLAVLTAAQNVELPLLLRKDLSNKQRRERVRLALSVVGLGERMDHYPRELSGGQEQRVAIARAIVTDPKILIADEPTGDLDRENADSILDLLGQLNKEFGKTIFMVTHDPEAAARATKQRVLKKGRLL
jgi:putative ABC transport system ATP-binding protein